MTTRNRDNDLPFGEWKFVAALHDLGGQGTVQEIHERVGGLEWNDSYTRTYLRKLAKRGWVIQYKAGSRPKGSGGGRPQSIFKLAVDDEELFEVLGSHVLDGYCAGNRVFLERLAGFLNEHIEKDA